MTKTQLQAQLEAKKGFVSIIKDALAPDHVAGDPIEKRFWYVNHTNADGTAGKTYVYYLHDTQNDTAWFYNQEIEAVDAKEPSAEQKKLNALQSYLKATFDAFFIVRFDLINNWAEADVFKLTNGQLVQSKVLVFKRESNPIAHLTIT
jgi:hypothetical protein